MTLPPIRYAHDTLADQIHRALHPRIYTTKRDPAHPGWVFLTDQDGNFLNCTEAIAKQIMEAK